MRSRDTANVYFQVMFSLSSLLKLPIPLSGALVGDCKLAITHMYLSFVTVMIMTSCEPGLNVR